MFILLQKYARSLLKKCIKDFTKAITSDPEDAMAYYRGLCKLKLKNYIEAILDFTEAITLNPTNNYAYYDRGNCKRALEDFTQALKLNLTHAEAYFYRGCSKQKLGDKEAACIDWQQATKLGYPDAYNNIGNHCN